MTVRTAVTHPLDVHCVPDQPTSGALGLTLDLGKHGSTFYGPTPWPVGLDDGDDTDAAIARMGQVQPSAIESGELAAYVLGFLAWRGTLGRPGGAA